ncbi:lactate dehydrogenase [Promicromonospora sp. MEB111]|uniref:lactate/malate family dehydrogenase n=1 Tax=Promicromonospora sp. MEB111 TaxID=3040301 RepID=UPI00254E94B0|nr:lactate dehydrogenase [Promicromonospora sp. MEB111]
MDVAVLGATGDVGRQVCTQLIAHGVLSPTSRLQLVGRPDGRSASAVHGLRTDLMDAFDERAPLIDVALAPTDVVADIVVVAAGLTAAAEVGSDTDRRKLAAANKQVFEQHAAALRKHGSGREVVIVVSNPVEVGVAVFADALGRHRVIGMGAWLDTLRFQREIALSLGVRRARVSGFVAGQHGERAVPLWSTVRIAGLDVAERQAAVGDLRRGRTLDTYADELAEARVQLDAVAARDVAEAFALVDTWPPDVRVVARPVMTHQSGAKTPAGTAAATVDMIATLLDGREIVVAGQVALENEVRIDGSTSPGRVLGVPVILGPEGWSRVVLDPLADDEAAALAASGRMIDAMLDGLGIAPAGADPVVGMAAAMPSEAGADIRTWEVDAEVRGADEVGVVATLTSVFSTRGVTVDAVSTGPGSANHVQLRFRAGARLALSLVRTLERLSMVRRVVVHSTR